MATPVVFGTRHLARVIPEFMERYPQIELKILMASPRMNMIEEGVDCVIRLARTSELDKRDRVLAPNRRVFCAAPAYLAANPIPVHPQDLAQQICLISMAEETADRWEYRDQSGVRHVRVKGPLSSDNADILRVSAVSGLGIAYLGELTVGDDLRAGRLRQVLTGHTLDDTAVVASVPHHGVASKRVRLFVDYLAAKLGNPASRTVDT